MPAGLRITHSVAGAKIFDRQLGVAADSVDDLRPAWDDAARVWHKNRAADFRTEGAHSGRKWKRLSPEYRKRKRRKWPGKTILRREDNLHDSLTSKTHKDSIFVKAAKWMEIGTADPKGTYHQTGTRTGLPKRPPIRMNESERRALTSIVHEFIIGKVRAAGGSIRRVNLGGRR